MKIGSTFIEVVFNRQNNTSNSSIICIIYLRNNERKKRGREKESKQASKQIQQIKLCVQLCEYVTFSMDEKTAAPTATTTIYNNQTNDLR